MSVRKPHTSEIRAAHPYLKKSWVAPPPPGSYILYVTVLQGFKLTHFKTSAQCMFIVYAKEYFNI